MTVVPRFASYLKNASLYGYDGTKTGVWGSSAGCHLVALLGTIGEGQEPDVDVPARMDHDSPVAPEARLLGGPVKHNAERSEIAPQTSYVTRDDPPFLIQFTEPATGAQPFKRRNTERRLQLF